MSKKQNRKIKTLKSYCCSYKTKIKKLKLKLNIIKMHSFNLFRIKEMMKLKKIKRKKLSKTKNYLQLLPLKWQTQTINHKI